jgi:hypothetical protein
MYEDYLGLPQYRNELGKKRHEMHWALVMFRDC